jgi:hypothetical protein
MNMIAAEPPALRAQNSIVHASVGIGSTIGTLDPDVEGTNRDPLPNFACAVESVQPLLL